MMNPTQLWSDAPMSVLAAFLLLPTACSEASSSPQDDGAVGGHAETGGDVATGGATLSGGTSSGGSGSGSGGVDGGGGSGTGGDPATCVDSGAAESFSFFLTSWHHIQELSGSTDGFGGDLRYGGATSGLEGADAICQEIAERVCFGQRTWKAFLSASTEDAIDRIGAGPWYDYAGNLVANDAASLVSQERFPGGCCDLGMYDELGVFHDGKTDVNNDGQPDDDHDVLTASNQEGRYQGFSCDDWTSTTASDMSWGPTIGHSWPHEPANSWVYSHHAKGCAAGTNFIQNGMGEGNAVGTSGGYGALYCFAL